LPADDRWAASDLGGQGLGGDEARGGAQLDLLGGDADRQHRFAETGRTHQRERSRLLDKGGVEIALGGLAVGAIATVGRAPAARAQGDPAATPVSDPAGWYDVTGDGCLSYWDGTAYTGEIKCPTATASAADATTPAECVCAPTAADLSRLSLVGADLPGRNLSNVNFTDANLSKANLTNATLVNADLTGANLTCANLTGVTLSNTTCPDGTNTNNNVGACCGHLGDGVVLLIGC
jgi:Pentapeptide repeats (8 copies)